MALNNVTTGFPKSVIPDSDLTQYTLTDPDGRISNIIESSYDANLQEGANDVSRLYRQIDPTSYRWVFDITVLNDEVAGEQAAFGWSTEDNEVFVNVSTFIGIRVLTDGGDRLFDICDADASPTSRDEMIANYSVNTTYTIQLDFNLDGGELTATVFNGESEEGSATRSFDQNLQWEYNYAHMAAGADFSGPGSLEYDFENNQTSSL